MPLPVNISLMNVDEFVDQHQCKPVTSLFIKESSSDEFHHAGLFSEEIFGQLGSTERLITFGYIDLHTVVLQPLVYGYLIRLKALYGDIMAGKARAVYDENLNDFVRADPKDTTASTGYKFFIDHFPTLNLKKTGSVTQGDKVDLINKYRSSCTITKMLVLPAGLRDMSLDDGKPASDSINKLYSSLINYASAMPSGRFGNMDIYDSVRFSIQKKVVEIYSMLYDMIEGKFGYFQRKFSSRNLALGTRNVITPADMTGAAPTDAKFLKCDEVRLPLFQAAKMYQPLVVYQMKKLFFSNLIKMEDDQVPVVDPDTFRIEYRPITEDEKNRFITSEGLEKRITLFKDKEFRFDPVTIKDEDDKRYYLMLIYDDGNVISISQSVGELETTVKLLNRSFHRDKIRPITWAELMYIAVHAACQNKHAYVTRYPALEIGSTVPCKAHLGSTTPCRTVNHYVLTSSTSPGGGVELADILPEYPILGASFVDTTVLHPSILKGLGADFDQFVSVALRGNTYRKTA